MRIALGALVGFVFLLTASPAVAAQRYASPAGSGEACTQVAPCELKEAVEKAESNDEVIVTPGTYALAARVATPLGKTGIDIHGESGAATPRISAAGAFPLIEVGAGNRLSHLEAENSATGAGGFACSGEAQIDRVRVAVTGESAHAVSARGVCMVRDSLLLATGKGAVGLSSGGEQGTAVVRNLTVIVTGGESVGVISEASPLPFGGATHLADLQDSIVRAEGTDLVAHFESIPIPMLFEIEGTGDISVSHSNFISSKAEPPATITEGPGNQKSAPLFVDAPNGDYREAAGSPTIDAGAADQLGPLDLDGNPRTAGSAPDIGAYEFPPTVCGNCGAPGGVRSISIKPKRFGAWARGGPIAPAVLKSRPPKGALVTYTMTGSATVRFSVSRKVVGRRVGKGCKRRSRANAGHRKCAFFVPLKGSFSQEGAAGANHFVFSGRIGGRALKAGAYALSANAGHLVSAGFEIGGLRRRHRHR